jgi:hypothetical protein
VCPADIRCFFKDAAFSEYGETTVVWRGRMPAGQYSVNVGGVNVWVTMLNFLLDFPMPCFIVVGCSRALTGLQIPYRDNEDIRKLVRRAAALPLVPEHQVEDAWFHCLQDLDATEISLKA